MVIRAISTDHPSIQDQRIAVIPAPDPRITALASRISSPSAAPENTEALLREMGRKTFLYQNPLPVADPKVDWREKTDSELKTFIRKTTILSTVTIMDGNLSQALAMEIVNDACRSNHSIYEVFMEKAGQHFSFFGKVAAWWKYFFYYQCGIIPNTIDTFLQTFLDKMRSELVEKEGGKNLSSLNGIVLNEFSSFLDLHLQAVEDYANGKDLKGDLDHELNRKLEIPLDPLCLRFAQIAVREFLPRVHFFKTWKDSSEWIVRIAGIVFDATIGWCLNNILRSKLKEQIPPIIKSVIEKGGDSANPENLPFAISITQGVQEQLHKFKLQAIKAEHAPIAAPNPVAGTEKLQIVVKKLLEVLRLNPYKTRRELQEHLHDKPDDSEVAESIKESVIDGCRLFLSYLSNPKNSEEIFFRLLNLSNAPFDAKPPTTQDERNALQAQYAALQKEMHSEAREIFQTISQRSVAERLHGIPKEKLAEMQKSFAEEQQKRASATADDLQKQMHSIEKKLGSLFVISVPAIDRLKDSCLSMQRSAPAAMQASLAEFERELESLRQSKSVSWTDFENLHRTFAAIGRLLPALPRQRAIEIRQRYNSMHILLEEAIALPDGSFCIASELDSMNETISRYRNQAVNDNTPKDRIDSLHIIFENMFHLLDQLSAAKGQQTDLSQDLAIAKDLRQINARLRMSMDFSQEMVAQYRALLERMKQRSPADASKFEEILQTLQPIYTSLETEKRILESISALAAKGGALSQLGSAVEARLSGKNSAIRNKDILNIPSLPPEEKMAIQADIDSLAASAKPEELQTRWNTLKERIRFSYQMHQQKEKSLCATQARAMQDARKWTDQQLQEMSLSLEKSHLSLMNVSKAMSERIEAIASEVPNISREPPETLLQTADAWRKKLNETGVSNATIGAAAGGAIGWGMAQFLGPVGGAIAGAAAGAVKGYQNSGTLRSTIKDALGGAVLGAAGAAIPFPFAGPAVAAAIGGYAGKTAAEIDAVAAISETQVYPKVIAVYYNLYDFILEPHVWKWAFKDALKCVNNAYTA